MFTSQLSRFFNFPTLIAFLFLLTDHSCFCMNFKSINVTATNGFGKAVATWYGPPKGSGSGGACGFENDIAFAPYNGMISAGNQILFKSGHGCGSCYQVKCTDNPSCSGNAIIVTITDECPGACNNDRVHFDLSGKAFGALAKLGQEDKLRNAGRINIQYQSVQCHYKVGITIKIDAGSNRNYLAFAIESVGGDGDIGAVQLTSPRFRGTLNMEHSWGATWKVGLPVGISGPYSVKLTTIESKQSYFLPHVIPANWAPGQHYHG